MAIGINDAGGKQARIDAAWLGHVGGHHGRLPNLVVWTVLNGGETIGGSGMEGV
jgi:hypothetical protein